METSPKEKITEQDANDIKEISSITTSYYWECHENAKNNGTDPGCVLDNLESYIGSICSALNLLDSIKDCTDTILSAIFDSMKDSKKTGSIQIDEYSRIFKNLIDFVDSEERLNVLYKYFSQKYNRLNNIDENDLEKALSSEIN